MPHPWEGNLPFLPGVPIQISLAWGMGQMFRQASRLIYGAVTGSLMLLALLFVVSAWFEVIAAALTGGDVISVQLHSIGLLVIALAVFDVAKFLWEEEIQREKELRFAREARQTLTKFLTIIIIAVALEALIFIFDAGKEDVTTLLYPTLLLFVVVLMVVGLAVYQRTMRSAEQIKVRNDEENPE